MTETNEEFFKARKDRVALIWISCLSAEKTLKEVQDDWGYSRGALYRDKLAERMREYGLLRLGNTVRSGRPTYYSQFQNYFKLANSLGYYVGVPSIPKDADLWADFLGSPKVRKAFFDTGALKALFASENEDTKKNLDVIAERAREHGLHTPVFIAITMAFLFVFLRNYGIGSKQLKAAAPLMPFFLPKLPGANMEAYFDAVSKVFPIEEIDNYPAIKTTEYFKEQGKILKPAESQLGGMVSTLGLLKKRGASSSRS